MPTLGELKFSGPPKEISFSIGDKVVLRITKDAGESERVSG